MKIALAHSFLTSRGGGERFVLEAAKAWKASHDVSVYTWDYAPEKTFPEFSQLDVRVIGKLRAPSSSLSKLVSWSSLKPDADVVSAHGFPAHFSSFRHPSVVYYFHIVPGFISRLRSKNPVGRYYASSLAALDKRAVSRCASLAANSQFISRWAERHYSRKVSVVNPGIHPEEYSCREYGEFALCVSRLVPEKGVLELVRQWDKRSSAGLQLVLVGMGAQSFVEGLEREARGKDVRIISGGISDSALRRLYSECRCLVLPSQNEPFGMVLLEAMASSKPVVARASGGPLEIVAKGTGLLAANDSQFMSSVRKLAKDESLARKMGGAGRKHAASFVWKNQLQKLEKILERSASRQ